MKGNCRGYLHDTILDWEDSLPAEEMKISELNCKNADLCLCLGTTLQIMPVGNYPLLSKKHKNGKIVIINLQETRLDKNADLIINSKLDLVFNCLFEKYFNVNLDKKRIIEIKLRLDDEDDEISKAKNEQNLLINLSNFFVQ